MARKGLGKGLDSLIPDIYDKDFDSNSPKSLEDILNDVSKDPANGTSSTDEKIDAEDPVDTNSSTDDIKVDAEDPDDETKIDADETSNEEVNNESEIVNDNDVEGNNTDSDGNEEIEEEISVEEKKEESSTDEETSKDLSDDKNSEENIQTSQEIQVQKEHVDEVKKIVDKNPRITLWSSRSSAVFRYLRKTEPEFSISKEASVLIEEAVSKKYPEIWALFEDE